MIYLFFFVVELLSVAQLPVAHHQHQNWACSEHLKSSIVQPIVHHRWLLVEVSKLEFISYEEIEQGYEADWKQNRQSKPVHHCNKNLSQY